ncbi:MAG: hypothetical protein RIS38_1487, partial [Verrucomicrobiota bacterium]
MHRTFFVLFALGLGISFTADLEAAASPAQPPAKAAEAPAVTWLSDLEEGLKQAREEKKAVLVDFTGSDWCGWCIRLKKEVFDQKAFAAVTKDFVLVELDYPQKKKQDPAVQAKNKAIAEKFAIEG